MPVEVSFDPVGALPYIEDRIRKIFRLDAGSLELAAWFKQLQKTSLLVTANVHLVGMEEAIPFDNIYQPTVLAIRGMQGASSAYAHETRASRSIRVGRQMEQRLVNVEDFVASGQNAIVKAGPGWGKTTFVHHVYRRLIRTDGTLPVLITLRRPTAVDNLERFVKVAERLKKNESKSRVLLLVDGYDEVSVPDRRRVSEALLAFQSLGVGAFYLTCRDYYDVFLITAPEVRVCSFSSEDMLKFIRGFLQAYRSKLDPKETLDDLEAHGFSDFLSHPLLLALACIVKAGAASTQPKSPLRLLERAITVLCFRWDEGKGVERVSSTALDGTDRLEILKCIAYRARSPFMPADRVESIARQEIDSITQEKIDARRVLIEAAQFYGILVPSDEGYEFVHRTVHDYLAARYWVEKGEFAKITRFEWNSRTAYAACIAGDATHILEAALAAKDGLPAVSEILSNAPRFQPKRVADAILAYFSKHKSAVDVESSQDGVRGRLATDFVKLGSNSFLNYLIEACCGRRSPVNDLIVGYCLVELQRRQVKVDFQTYAKLTAAYKTDRYEFVVSGCDPLELRTANPAARKTLPGRLIGAQPPQS